MGQLKIRFSEQIDTPAGVTRVTGTTRAIGLTGVTRETGATGLQGDGGDGGNRSDEGDVPYVSKIPGGTVVLGRTPVKVSPTADEGKNMFLFVFLFRWSLFSLVLVASLFLYLLFDENC